jgi:hypothetical protein
MPIAASTEPNSAVEGTCVLEDESRCVPACSVLDLCRHGEPDLCPSASDSFYDDCVDRCQSSRPNWACLIDVRRSCADAYELAAGAADAWLRERCRD